MSGHQQNTQAFIDYLKFQKRYSQHTITGYTTDLKDFFDFADLNFATSEVSQITSAIIRSWLASLKEEKLSSRSVNRKISTLRSFFKYLLRQQVITINPLTQITALKTNKRLPSFVEEKDIDKLFEQVAFPETWQGATDKLIIKLFYNTGIRLSELINLKPGQVNYEQQNIKVLGKGNKERLIPVSDGLLKDVKNYLEKKADKDAADNSVIFVTDKGKKLYPKYVYNIVKDKLEKVITNKKKSPHVLRHTFATHLANNGADINAVKELLGHSSLAATQIYVHNSIQKLKDIHKKAHPKA